MGSLDWLPETNDPPDTGWQEAWQKLERNRALLAKARLELEADHERLQAREADLEVREAQAEKLARIYRHRLRSLAGTTREEARELLRVHLLETSADEAREIRREILFETEQEAREEARRIIIDVMQRMATNPERQLSATLVTIPSEDMKGRIIGREGRNIRAFENLLGVTLMIDDTPGSILVSSFDPVRRETARRTLEELIADGRIHPASIEETYERVAADIRDTVYSLGEDALLKLRLTGVPPEVVGLVGSLHYRLSNNQNTLEHSLEVAFFAALLASELGLDPEPAKRIGLFHDLGKALNQEHGGSHAAAAANLLRRYGENEVVVNAVAASHGEVEPTSLYAEVLKIADALSAARPGARADSLDSFIQRVRSLEELARGFRGVSDAFAIQAGREIRVLVKPEIVSDEDARTLARNLRRFIEDELNYPGTIKVTVIREQRFNETAL
ncbi:MAG: ribonuclease Y [Opitutales bacterium]